MQLWQKGSVVMAAGQFSPSHTRRAARSRPRFTVDQANSALPLVRRIVRDIVNSHEQAAQLQAKLDEAPTSRDAAAAQSQLEVTLRRLEEYVDELRELGIELKDYQTGLVDFPSRHLGRDIWLCWKLGEEKVEYWHELHAGFAGRQPVSALRDSA